MGPGDDITGPKVQKKVQQYKKSQKVQTKVKKYKIKSQKVQKKSKSTK